MADVEQLKRARDSLVQREQEILVRRQAAQQREREALDESRAVGREYKDTHSAIVELERQIREAESPVAELRPGVDAIVQSAVASAQAMANGPNEEV